jgi:hypothetical protein
MKFIKILWIHDDVKLPRALLFQHTLFFSWHLDSNRWEIINKSQHFNSVKYYNILQMLKRLLKVEILRLE